MSRTIRRMPISARYNYTGKSYVSCFSNTKPDYAGIRLHYGYRIPFPEDHHDWQKTEEWRRNGGNTNINRIIVAKDTQEDKEKEFEEEILEFSRKNGTCKRQRKNGVRITKQIDRRQRRACLKMALIKELTMVEQEVPDVSKRRTISEKRKSKTLAHQTKWRQRKLQDALEKSTAKTFDDLYVENQWYYGED